MCELQKLAVREKPQDAEADLEYTFTASLQRARLSLSGTNIVYLWYIFYSNVEIVSWGS
jgi:hypothetical protein